MTTLKEQLQYHNELFSEVIDNFDKLYNAGQIDDEEYDELVLNARIELQQRIDAELGIETDENEELEYADGGDYAEFSVGSTYGAALLELGEAAGYEDIESWCVDLGEATGYSPDDIFAVVTGEVEPTDEFSLDIAETLDLDEDTQAALLIYGIEARGEDVQDYLDDEDEEEYEDEIEYTDEEEESSYALAQVQNELAEFKATGIVKDELADIEARAWSLAEEGRVPPSVIEKLLGNFSNENDRIAAFSTVCDRNDVDAATELYAMNKVLRVLESFPVLTEFGFDTLEEVSDEEIEEEQSLDSIANNYLKFYNSNRTHS